MEDGYRIRGVTAGDLSAVVRFGRPRPCPERWFLSDGPVSGCCSRTVRLDSQFSARLSASGIPWPPYSVVEGSVSRGLPASRPPPLSPGLSRSRPSGPPAAAVQQDYYRLSGSVCQARLHLFSGYAIIFSKGGGPMPNCACGTWFEPSRMKPRKWCSRPCYLRHYRRDGRRPRVVCEWCGGALAGRPDVRRRFCSPRCKQAAAARKRKRESSLT